ncbi:MAG: hypothetical protein RIC82_04465, partial [Parvibaculum sp.]
PWVNLAVIAALGILTFVPLKFIHPFRVTTLRPLTLAVTTLWALATFWLVVASGPDSEPSEAAPAAFWAFVASSLYFLGLCAWRSAMDRKTVGNS